MSRIELISDSLRVDGRKPLELRRFKSSIGIISADGSCFLSTGNTRLLVQVYGPKEVYLKLTQPKYNKPQECRLNVKVKICSFATNRKVYKSDKRLIEMASMIKSCFEPVLQLDLYSRSEIDVYVTVLQSDGGVLAAAINAATLAFIDSGIPMIDYVSACTVGYANDEALVDLNDEEESSECPTLTIATLPKSGQVVLCSMECRLHLDNLEKVLRVGQQACERVGERLEESILQLA